MTTEQFEQFKIDYLNWVAQERVRHHIETQQLLQRRFQEKQRKEQIEYRMILESFKQLKIDF